jgi:pyruvate/2-oxoglutarate/acetoin dehydrogenase E1 component
VLMPTSPRDAKGLMISALQHDGPVVILEHRSLFGLKGEVPEEPYGVPIGKAEVVRAGTDVTVVSTSFMTVEALRAAEELAKDGVSLEVIDLRSIRPLDEATILASVEKTGRLIVTDTSWEMCGVVSEVAALAAEKAFHSLKGPVRRIALPNCPAPVSQALEDVFYPKASTIAKAALVMLGQTSYSIGEIDMVDDFKGPY